MGAINNSYSTGVSEDVFNVTPADAAGVSDGTTARSLVRQIYVGGAGNVKYDSPLKTGVVLTVPAGFTVMCAMTKIWATGTTATNIIAFG